MWLLPHLGLHFVLQLERIWKNKGTEMQRVKFHEPTQPVLSSAWTSASPEVTDWVDEPVIAISLPYSVTETESCRVSLEGSISVRICYVTSLF